jgi:hypothetical protein
VTRKVSGPKDTRRHGRARRGSKSKRHAGVQDVVELVRDLFPDGIVELPYDFDELDIETRSADLISQLRDIEGAELLYEQDPRGGPVWDDDADPQEDPPTDLEHTRSYQLLFLALRGEPFRYATEDIVEDEPGVQRKVPGTGRIGCVVAVSLLAPLAIVKFGDMEQLDDGSQILPQLDDTLFDLDVRPIDPETHFRNMMGEEAVEALQRLAETITARLAARGFRTLATSELDKPLRGLRAGEETLIGADPDCIITVRDALFFEQL